MTTYGYSRVSDISQVDGCSLADQERVIRGCAMMRGDDDVVMFSDPDVSGYSIPLAERPAGGRMMRGLKRGDIVIASKMDRIFRNASDALACAQKFRADGVGLILCDMGVDPVTGNGAAKMFFGMLAMFAEFERDRIAERTADGRRGKKAKGGHIGGSAPYGFRAIGSGRASMLAEYLPEQRNIQSMKVMRGHGMSYSAIALRLTQCGITNRLGKPFAKTQVLRILGRSETELAA